MRFFFTIWNEDSYSFSLLLKETYFCIVKFSLLTSLYRVSLLSEVMGVVTEIIRCFVYIRSLLLFVIYGDIISSTSISVWISRNTNCYSLKTMVNSRTLVLMEATLLLLKVLVYINTKQGKSTKRNRELKVILFWFQKINNTASQKVI